MAFSTYFITLLIVLRHHYEFQKKPDRHLTELSMKWSENRGASVKRPVSQAIMEPILISETIYCQFCQFFF